MVTGVPLCWYQGVPSTIKRKMFGVNAPITFQTKAPKAPSGVDMGMGVPSTTDSGTWGSVVTLPAGSASEPRLNAFSRL